MITTEILQGGKLIRHYSDQPKMGLLQEDTRIEYSEAVDINPTSHTYREIPMEQPEEKSTEEQLAEAQEALQILTGKEITT